MRGSGVGRVLLSALVLASSAGIAEGNGAPAASRIVIDVSAANGPAVAFFEAAGFVRTASSSATMVELEMNLAQNAGAS